MDEMNSKGTQPLRSTSNKLKDLYNTYLKNEEREIPIKDSESEEMNDADVNSEENVVDNSEIFDIDAEELQEQMGALVEQLNEAEKQRDDLKEQLIRKVAELENIRRRSIKEKQEMIDYANERLLYKMLDMLDDMGNAITAGKKSEDKDTLLQGVEMIQKKAIKLFEEAGVKTMDDSTGNPFDVDYHEALMHIPTEDIPEGHVVQTVQTGYMIAEKVLRHAKVITSAGKAEEEKVEENK